MVNTEPAILAEIASQPAHWRRAATLARTREAALPRPGERVAVVGCGASRHIARSYAALRESTGQGETDAFTASEMPVGRRYHRVLVITRSGTTTGILDLLGQLPGGQASCVVTAHPRSRVVALAGDVVALDFADERTTVRTRFATSALALLRAHLGGDVGAAAADAEHALAGPLPLDPDEVEQVTFLGRGWTVGLAYEAARKLRETAAVWAEAYPAPEYLTGPGVARPGQVVWHLGPAPAGVVEAVTATGARLVTSDLDPAADLVRVQRVAVAVARRRGLDPGHPGHPVRPGIRC